MTRRLSAAEIREFRSDIAAGRGRAWLRVNRRNGRYLVTEIERACLENRAFDL